MNKFLVLIAFLLTTIVNAQETTGSIAGKLTDREMNGEPLPFANVTIKGTSKGTTSDYDGLYVLDKIEPGTYTVVFSFVGYETLEIPNVKVVADKVTEINTGLGASAATLDEVVITTVSRRDSEVALLLEQKGAIEIKESIGAQQLAKMGVSDVATATTKISGVTSSEASGDVFVRGLGDRYLYTTMNGLPVPSDDVERKNIDLELFPTRVIQNVSISKTYSSETSADQSSGNIDISTRELAGRNELNLGIKIGINTNVTKNGIYDNFKVSPNQDDITLGFYKKDLPKKQALYSQSWSPQKESAPIDNQYSIVAGTKIGEKLEVFFTGSQSTKYSHNQGVFRQFQSNFINDSITDAEIFSKSVNTTALGNIIYEMNENNTVKFNSLLINKVKDEVYEGGRNGEGVIFEETNPKDGLFQFIRDQNTKQTRLLVNQLIGEHKIGEKHAIDWAAGLNIVDADEPNRIRNEVNFDPNSSFVQLGTTGGFQQRKTAQAINDEEFSGLLKDKISLITEEERKLSITVGGNYRNKDRDFASQFVGVEEKSTNTLNPTSIDDISSIFILRNFQNGNLTINELQIDRYKANLTSASGFASANYEIGKFNFNIGARYQNDQIEVTYDVGNIPGRIGSSQINNDNIYPTFNIKYGLSDKTNLRIAGSKTITLPEFKEIAPFEYVSPTGQVTRGNQNLEASKNYNLDVKYEFFPSNDELISLTGFYKNIKDPINKVQTRGSSGVFSYFNSGNEANIYGIELESRFNLFEATEELPYNFNFNFNATRMWHSQDLKDVYNDQGGLVQTFKYKDLKDSGLQGASDWILNGSVNFSTDSENPLLANITASYASDKIYALGTPANQQEYQTQYNEAIIEKGFVTLDAVLNQSIGEHWNFRIIGKNLLNPEIQRTQKIKPSTTSIETEEVVRSYTRGSILSLGLNYNF
ncbi:TonB-dependent receptor [Zunongwangia pacifica]|uniref:TonB-dependent receptor n=1 Tax=Zunongwangia pacifica TaxID=2911062 RepID=A0A9X1ZUQ5_9FLAO|nr:TonB-dependent receptor [Zunongwangia pacifica]MCL6216716.1 TonB-dependent receptor [Zunongwangia pacifica]